MDGDEDAEPCQCDLKGQRALELAGENTGGVPWVFGPALCPQAFWSYIHAGLNISHFCEDLFGEEPRW